MIKDNIKRFKTGLMFSYLYGVQIGYVICLLVRAVAPYDEETMSWFLYFTKTFLLLCITLHLGLWLDVMGKRDEFLYLTHLGLLGFLMLMVVSAGIVAVKITEMSMVVVWVLVLLVVSIVIANGLPVLRALCLCKGSESK